MKPISQETRIFLAIWRKAIRGGEDITIKMENNTLAMSARMAMYRAIRPYREGTIVDNELAEAASKFVIVHQKKPCALVLTSRRTLAAAEDMAALLGLEDDDLLTPDELEQRERLLAIQEETPIPEHIETPFYTREA